MDILKVTGEPLPYRVLYIDNDINNIKSAKEIGILTCHVVQGSNGVPLPNTVDFQIDTIYHVQTDLKELKNFKRQGDTDEERGSPLAIRNDIVNTKSKLISNSSTNLDKRHMVSSTLLQEDLPFKPNPIQRPSPIVNKASPTPEVVEIPSSIPVDKKTPLEKIKLNSIDPSSSSNFNNTNIGVRNSMASESSSSNTPKKKKKRKKKEKEPKVSDGAGDDSGSEKKRVKQLPPLQTTPNGLNHVIDDITFPKQKQTEISNTSELLKDLNLDEAHGKKKLNPLPFRRPDDDPFSIQNNSKKAYSELMF
ncbi:hypothetical protein C9374_000524 [Naegleria lovaniensis]|uniref:Uncharacterized protein n=1 Tax=Naegleria lovaniensis TaxID=51637 RepID=A0AA88KLX7_NAELO|nr:uncharacterized protein C9374_000524 [Naegleria lovaniensis]KAG2388360.1 hypothetical protein C9374_000524 [Naegleria lovaniensis]